MNALGLFLRGAWRIGLVLSLFLVLSIFFEELWHQILLLALPVVIIFVGIVGLSGGMKMQIEAIGSVGEGFFARFVRNLRDRVEDEIQKSKYVPTTQS